MALRDVSSKVSQLWRKLSYTWKVLRLFRFISVIIMSSVYKNCF